MQRRTFSRLLAGALFATTAALAAAPALAEAWPSKPIKFIVPYPPGGAADATGRIYAEGLAKLLGQPVVVENRAGAGTAIAAEALAKSPPDGYTVALAPSGQLAVLPHLAKELRYDPFTSFAPISLLGVAPSLIAVHPGVPASNLGELIALAKREPGKLAYATSGAGAISHLTGAYFADVAGIDLLHVPFKGSAPAITAVIGGEVPVSVDSLTVLLPQVKAGKARALAFTTRERSPLLPEVPTVAESGYPGFAVEAWFGLVAPAGTPPEIVQRLNALVAKIAADADNREKFAAYALAPVVSTPEGFAARIREDHAKLGQIIAKAKITLE